MADRILSVDSVTYLPPQKVLDALADVLPGATPENVSAAVAGYLSEHPPVGSGDVLLEPHPDFPGVAILTVGGGGGGLVVPVVTAHPESLTGEAGEPAVFSAAATGTPTPARQWQRSTDGGESWEDVPGATTATYTIPALAVGDSGHWFRCVFTNSAGSAATDAAVLTVTAAPVITLAPVASYILSGGTFSWTAGASGVPEPTAQWQTFVGSDYVDIPGATGTTLTLTEAQYTSSVYCLFTNSAGSTRTGGVGGIVRSAVAITSQPTDQSVADGASVTFTIAYTPTSSGATFRWERSTDDGETWETVRGPIQSYGARNYTFTATVAMNGHRFRCVVYNEVSSVTSNVVTLTVASGVAPTITSHPTGGAGTSTLAVVASGTAPLSYRWQVNSTGDIWVDLTSSPQTVTFGPSGDKSVVWAGSAASASVDMDPVLGLNGVRFRCVVTNAFGSAASNPAAIDYD